MESLLLAPWELDTTLTPSVRASNLEITSQADHIKFISGVLTATQDSACQWYSRIQEDSCRYEQHKQRGSSSLYVCVSHAELSKQTEGRLKPKYELGERWVMLIQLNVTLFPKPHKDKYACHHMTYTHINVHAHTHKYTLREPLKAMEHRVIIMRVNSRTPLSSSAGWRWEPRPTGPAGNGNPHTASCHCFEPPYYTLSLQCRTVGIIPYVDTWRHMRAFGLVCVLELKKYSADEHPQTWTHSSEETRRHETQFSVLNFTSLYTSLNRSKEIKIIMKSHVQSQLKVHLLSFFLSLCICTNKTPEASKKVKLRPHLVRFFGKINIFLSE